MILNVIKWCTVQGQLGSGQGARSCASEMAAISSLILFSSPEYRWIRKEILPIRALWNGRRCRVSNKFSNFGKNHFTAQSQFSFLKKKKKRGKTETLPQFGNRTHKTRTRIHPNPTVFPPRSQTWFQDLINFKFLMSHHRKNSMRDKVIGKK